MGSLLKKAIRYSDLAAAIVVVMVIIMMVVPLPAALLDVLITLNIAGGLAILIATMYVPSALDFASFPSLLLLSTLFRLAINVSVTRLILLQGDAGDVVNAFGNFVVGGNLIVGLVIFLILVVIQFVVITNGAGRVAEVAARFTLDAMPGKQMAIDADLNAGQITDQEATERREEIRREADFYGAMDGASKFVKGDAIAGVIIVVVNLLGGIAVGVIQQGNSIGEAAERFSILTIGDGLSAQIPALLISTAMGIIVTRSASNADLGSDITYQLFGQPRATTLAGAVICLLGFVPGLPLLPFLGVGSLLFLAGRTLSKDPIALKRNRGKAKEDTPDEETAAQPPDGALGALAIDPLELAIGFGLVPLVDQGSGGSLLARVGVVRRQIASDLGIVIAPVRIHDEVALDSHEYVVRVRGSEVARSRVIPGHEMAMNPGDALPGLAGIPTTEPAFGLPALWIEDAVRAEAAALGYTVVDAESVVVTHLTETIRRHADELLTREEVKLLLDGLKEHNATAVDDIVPEKLGYGEVQRVLQHLLREGVSIRDLGTILEAIGDRSAITRDPGLLAEYARQALGRTITSGFVDQEQTLNAISLAPELEQEVAESLTHTPEGEFLAMDPTRVQDLVGSLAGQVERSTSMGKHPVLICSSRVRS
ncbi:MAG: flagellar biosynthesis protein FlhA, partial [Gaiellaceae bacterium]